MSKVMPIEEIGLDDQGHLFVRPSGASADEFAYVYRDGSGIRWNSHFRALHAADPARWAVTALYKQFIAAAHREYGVQLQRSPTTVWSGIPDDVRTAIEAEQTDATVSGSLAGMTVNERLNTLGLLSEFDAAARRRDRQAMLSMLRRAELSEFDAIDCADAIIADPTRYGF